MLKIIFANTILKCHICLDSTEMSGKKAFSQENLLIGWQCCCHLKMKVPLWHVRFGHARYNVDEFIADASVLMLIRWYDMILEMMILMALGLGVLMMLIIGKCWWKDNSHQSLWDYSSNDEKVTINLCAIIHSAAKHTLWHTGTGRHHAGGGRRKKQQEVRRNILNEGN